MTLLQNKRRKVCWNVPDRFDILRTIGQGSYGSVCEAMDLKAKRKVAVKRLNDMFDNLEDCRRLLREIAFLNRLKHPNIIRFIGVHCPEPIETFEELFIFMDLCDTDLQRLFDSKAQLSMPHVKTLLANLLTGLKYLHSAGIYHRDLKPANCFCNKDCKLLIGDFGLARAVNASGDLSDSDAESRDGIPQSPPALERALTSHVVTRYYRAPEIILLVRKYTEAIDVWSVGCIYAEMLQTLPSNDVQKRGPLFPGSCSFPLSPDHFHKQDYRYHSTAANEQLNVIFDVIGTPTKQEMACLEMQNARAYLEGFVTREGVGVASKLPACSDSEALSLLTQMLKFNSNDRITVTESLEIGFLTGFRDINAEAPATQRLVLEFDREKQLSEAQLREWFGKEIQNSVLF